MQSVRLRTAVLCACAIMLSCAVVLAKDEAAITAPQGVAGRPNFIPREEEVKVFKVGKQVKVEWTPNVPADLQCYKDGQLVGQTQKGMRSGALLALPARGGMVEIKAWIFEKPDATTVRSIWVWVSE